MKSRNRRLLIAGVVVCGLIGVAVLVTNAFRSNMVFFYTPTQVSTGEAPQGKLFRIGGMVATGSVLRDGVKVEFDVTDMAKTVRVRYQGILPDLFKEGKGVVAQGRMQGAMFEAQEVLAKHDENYMPPEAAHALEKAGAAGGKPGGR